jgi:hypothetical protein
MLAPINSALLISPTVGPSQETLGDFHYLFTQQMCRTHAEKAPTGCSDNRDLPGTPAICPRGRRAPPLVAAGLITNLSTDPGPQRQPLPRYASYARLSNPDGRIAHSHKEMSFSLPLNKLLTESLRELAIPIAAEDPAN